MYKIVTQLITFLFFTIIYCQKSSFYIKVQQVDQELFLNIDLYKSVKSRDEKTIIIRPSECNAGR